MKKILTKKVLMKKILVKKFFFSTCIKKSKTSIIKNTKKDSEKKHMKDIEIFRKKKKTKSEEKSKTDIKISLKKKQPIRVYEKIFST